MSKANLTVAAMAAQAMSNGGTQESPCGLLAWVFGLLLALGSAGGCNSSLSIEEGIAPTEVGDGAVSCGSDCKVCDGDEDCTAAERCTKGRCESRSMSEAGSDPQTREGGLPDAVDAGQDAGPDVGTCVEGALRCDAKAYVARSRCEGGTWKSAEACGEGQFCDSKAATPGECKPVLQACLGRKSGEPFCNGKDRIVCGPDLVTSTQETCSTGAHCAQSTGTACAVCLANEGKCDGNDLSLCSSDRSTFTPSQTCNVGECNAQLGRCTTLVCDPDAYDCLSNTLVKCNASGTANSTVKECGTGICDKQNRRCNMCQPGEVLGCGVDGNQEVCSADGQKVSRSCGSLDPSTGVCTGKGVCVSCKPLSQTCRGDTTLVTCSGTGTASETDCVDSTCVAGSMGTVDQCLSECAPGDRRCGGSASPARRQCGPTGAFTVSAACEGGTLCDTASTPAGVCRGVVNGCSGKQPGDVVCDGLTRVVCGPDLVTATSKSCLSPAHCQQGSGPECATCITGEHACVGAQLRECNATHTGFVDKELCTSVALCNKEVGACTASTCQPGAWSCNGNTLRHCNAGGTDYVATDTQACGAGLCNAGAQRCNVCLPDQIRCLEEGGKGRVQCSADGSAESGTTPCSNACLKGSCVACVPGATGCDPANALRHAQVCSQSGAWEGGTDCFASGLTCLYSASTGASGCGGSCAAGTFRCNSTTKNAEKCADNGTWQQADVCATNEICRVANDVASCDENLPYLFGNHGFVAADNWMTVSMDIDWAYFVPITTPARKVRVQALQLRAPGSVNGVANGGSCELALYTDNNGKPGAVVTASRDQISLPTSGGMSVAGSVPHLRALLSASTRYWVGGSCYRFSPKPAIYVREAPSSYRFYKVPGDPFPPNPAGSAAEAKTYPFYIEILDEP